MVGTVLVSHSQALAEAMVDYAHMMAPQAVVVAAGGLEDGTFGTSYEKIEDAIERAQQGDGVVVLLLRVLSREPCWPSRALRSPRLFRR